MAEDVRGYATEKRPQAEVRDVNQSPIGDKFEREALNNLIFVPSVFVSNAFVVV